MGYYTMKSKYFFSEIILFNLKATFSLSLKMKRKKDFNIAPNKNKKEQMMQLCSLHYQMVTFKT